MTVWFDPEEGTEKTLGIGLETPADDEMQRQTDGRISGGIGGGMDSGMPDGMGTGIPGSLGTSRSRGMGTGHGHRDAVRRYGRKGHGSVECSGPRKDLVTGRRYQIGQAVKNTSSPW